MPKKTTVATSIAKLRAMSGASAANCKAALNANGGEPNRAFLALIRSGKANQSGFDPALAADDHYALATLCELVATHGRKGPAALKAAGVTSDRLRKWKQQVRGDVPIEDLWLSHGGTKRRLARAARKSAAPTTRPPATPTWSHPDLGRFKYDGIQWVAAVPAPAFNAFRWCAGSRRPTGKYDLAFEADSETDFPSAVAVVLAKKVLAQQRALVPKITKALWTDFNGRGPNSGMWWHGGLDEVRRVTEAEGQPVPNGPDDLLLVMRLYQITVLKRVHRHPKPIIEFQFHASYEEEHGVGVLTDATLVLGTGYSSDVDLFKAPRPPAKRRRTGRAK